MVWYRISLLLGSHSFLLIFLRPTWINTSYRGLQATLTLWTGDNIHQLSDSPCGKNVLFKELVQVHNNPEYIQPVILRFS